MKYNKVVTQNIFDKETIQNKMIYLTNVFKEEHHDMFTPADWLLVGVKGSELVAMLMDLNDSTYDSYTDSIDVISVSLHPISCDKSYPLSYKLMSTQMSKSQPYITDDDIAYVKLLELGL